MAPEGISRVRGRAVPVGGDDVDTDRILPARFMRCVSFDGLGRHLFHGVRFAEDGGERPCPLNDPRFAAATVLLAGRNFGCGSSREHAPQAIRLAGFRAIVAESVAEIFAGNATALGIPCVSVTREAVAALGAEVERDPALELSVDLEAEVVSAGALRFPFWMKPGARGALLSGNWDSLSELQRGAAEVAAVARRLPYLGF